MVIRIPRDVRNQNPALETKTTYVVSKGTRGGQESIAVPKDRKSLVPVFIGLASTEVTRRDAAKLIRKNRNK